MTWYEILIIVLLLIGEMVCIYLANMARRIGVNNADILQNRAKEYEAEKGKNLATKEDITEITKKVCHRRNVCIAYIQMIMIYSS